ncbi:MAG: nucleotidyltransferase domain-containing protein [Bacteroidia bacterium]|nr:nucleotidyltransferase domain-containing protein [Bacteroidia bacterium]
MTLKEIIGDKSGNLLNLCLSHQVKELYFFGSAVKGTFDDSKSDLDILVTIDLSDPLDRGEKLISFWDNMELLFKRKVDLLTEPSIQNPFLLSSINSSKVLVYDRHRPEILI